MEDSFSSAIKIWEQINLGELQKTLDEQGLKIINNQKESLASRKQLAEQTRDFKRLSNEEKLIKFKSLLKAYQNEIDNITKRSKVSETAFLNVYKILLEAPDPSVLLTSVMDQNVNKEDLEFIKKENENLKNELKNLNNEFTDYKIKNSNVSVLKQQVVLYETKIEELVNEKVIEKEAEMKNVNDEKIMLFKEREHFLQRQVNQLKDQLMALQDNHDNTQAKIIDHSQKYEEEVAGKLAELEIITNDLENANINVAKLQQENENLRQQLKTMLNEISNDSNVKEKIVNNDFSFFTNTGDINEELLNLRKKCQTQDEEINQLIKSVERHKNITAKNELIFNSKIRDLEDQLFEANENVLKYKEKLNNYSDYKKIKEELEVLKSIEFSATTEFNNTQNTNAEQVPLEKLIMAKNKKLQTELTEKKMEVEQLNNTLNETTKNLEDSYSKVKEQSALISKLEEDLLKVNTFKSSNSQNQLLNSNENFSGNEEIYNNNNNSSNSISRNGTSDQDNKLKSPEANNNDENNSDSIIAILTSQRNRYRQRNQELEQQIRNMNDKGKDIELEVQSLKNDNIKLYEKIRYLQSFNKSTPYNSYEQSYNRNKKDHTVNIPFQSNNSEDNDVSEKYKTMYENSINPFNEFRGREENRKYRSLNTVEKVSLGITKIFLANKYSRIFFLSYILGLHLLVFIVIFKSINISDEDFHSSPLDVNNNRLY